MCKSVFTRIVLFEPVDVAARGSWQSLCVRVGGTRLRRRFWRPARGSQSFQLLLLQQTGHLKYLPQITPPPGSMQAAGTTTLLCCRQCCRVARLQQSATMGRQLLLPPLATHSCLTLEHQYAAAAAAAKAARKSRQSVRAASLYTSRLVDAAADVPVPLCRRSPQHTDQLASLMQWRDSVLQQVESIGEGFAAADGGPGAAELQREVTWVLDDVVAVRQQQAPAVWCLGPESRVKPKPHQLPQARLTGGSLFTHTSLALCHACAAATSHTLLPCARPCCTNNTRQQQRVRAGVAGA